MDPAKHIDPSGRLLTFRCASVDGEHRSFSHAEPGADTFRDPPRWLLSSPRQTRVRSRSSYSSARAGAVTPSRPPVAQPLGWATLDLS